MKGFDEKSMEESLGVRPNGHTQAAFVKPPADGARYANFNPSDFMGEIDLSAVLPDPDQPREEFDEQKLEELTASIRDKGQLQPCLVAFSRRHGKYVLIAGERRFRATQRAGKKTLLCVVSKKDRDDMSPAEILELQVVENCVRDDLKPIERAKAYKRLLDTGLTAKQVAERVNQHPSSVTQALKLLELPVDVQEKIEGGEVGPAAAYEVTKLEDPEDQREVIEAVIAEKLTLQDTRAKVKEKRQGKPASAPGKAPQPRVSTFTAKLPSKGWSVRVEAPKKSLTELEAAEKALAWASQVIERAKSKNAAA